MHVCDRLRAGFLGQTWCARPQHVPWEQLIEASSHHLVTPALAWCVNDDADLPSDIREYCAAALALNTRRNQYLLDSLERAVRALNAIDISPILLKGAASLVEDLYPAPGIRVLGDLDLLIAEERTPHAAAALREIGFVTDATAELIDHDHHHLPRLCDPHTGAGIELHKRVTPRAFDSLLPLPWFAENTVGLPFRGLNVRMPNPACRVAHNIVHHQLPNDYYRQGRINLRHLLDLVMLRSRYTGDIDWQELDRRFAAAGCGPMLSTILHLTEALFHTPAPKLARQPEPDAVQRLREGIEQRGSHRWLQLMSVVRRLRRNPSAAANLLNPLMWPRKIGTVAKIMLGRRW